MFASEEFTRLSVLADRLLMKFGTKSAYRVLTSLGHLPLDVPCGWDHVEGMAFKETK